MSGRFNIAVAEFGEVGADGQARPSLDGQLLSRAVFDKLRSEYNEHYPELAGAAASSVQIWHDNPEVDKNITLGVIYGLTAQERAAAAERLAEQIQADMVVYGYLIEQEGSQRLELEFYYRSDTLRGEPDAIAGRHRLGEAISLPVSFKQDPTIAKEWILEPLDFRTQALFWLTLGLTYDVLDKQEKSLEIFLEAEEALQEWEDADGKEVLYYFIGREAYWLRQYDLAIAYLEQAQASNPRYANAYATLGAVYYDRAQLYFVRDQPIPPEMADCVTTEHLEQAAATLAEAMADIDRAVDYLRQAVEIAPDSLWPPIEYISRLSLGFTYRLKGQLYLFAKNYEAAEPWFVAALEQFQMLRQVFDKMEQHQFLAWAYSGLGATRQMQAYLLFGQVDPTDSNALAAVKQAGAELFTSAAEHYEQCMETGNKVADLVFKREVVECGCAYYHKIVQEQQASLQQGTPVEP
jgi:tetratricopeptide (TPR) repeat protein